MGGERSIVDFGWTDEQLSFKEAVIAFARDILGGDLDAVGPIVEQLADR